VHQSYHEAITTFRAEGKTAFDAANPATLAHLMSSQSFHLRCVVSSGVHAVVSFCSHSSSV
jgi:hypothetical protein